MIRKLLTIFLCFCLAGIVHASVIVVFDETATPQKVLQVLASANTPDFTGRTDVVINPDLSALEGIVPVRYWKHSAGLIVEYTTAEKTQQDSDEAAAEDTAVREAAKAGLEGFVENPLLLRALADIIKDEINILRALHGLPDRTLSQLRTAIQNKIDGGTVDS